MSAKLLTKGLQESAAAAGLLARGTRGLAWDYTDSRFRSGGLGEECMVLYRSPSPPAPSPPLPAPISHSDRPPLAALNSVNTRSPLTSPSRSSKIRSDLVRKRADPSSEPATTEGFVEPASIWDPAGPVRYHDSCAHGCQTKPHQDAEEMRMDPEPSLLSCESGPAVFTCRALMTLDVERATMSEEPEPHLSKYKSEAQMSLADNELSLFLEGVKMARANLAEKLDACENALKEHTHCPLESGSLDDKSAGPSPTQVRPRSESMCFQTPRVMCRQGKPLRREPRRFVCPS